MSCSWSNLTTRSPVEAKTIAPMPASFNFPFTWVKKTSQLPFSGMGTATLRLGLASLTETKTRREASCMF